MTAHMRASRYRAQKDREQKNRKHSPCAPGKARAILSLGREYDAQARDNFVKEAVLFAVIIFVAIAWPLLESLRGRA